MERSKAFWSACTVFVLILLAMPAWAQLGRGRGLKPCFMETPPLAKQQGCLLIFRVITHVPHKEQQGMRPLPDRGDLFAHLGLYADPSTLIQHSGFATSGMTNYIDKTPPQFRRFEKELTFARNTRKISRFANA
ncbi:hypothetical protein HMPREF0645_0093 [Hallella bergensis DSM 17361]|uniref:Uncharacterized protein n=1 Tax=Hallella bergensis DSM 17361 TaxID=585502 RepID=D1PT08_9BACT|nr:hypothetical protein HMPREF0645_0093 [Hallella bergensis DSM 17361]